MPRLVVAPLVLIALALAPATAAAAEERLTPYPYETSPQELDAAGVWVSWSITGHSERPTVLLRGRAVSTFPVDSPSNFALGSDARGATVAVFTRYLGGGKRAHYSIVQSRLGSQKFRTIYAKRPYGTVAGDVARGSLAIADDRGVHLRSRGATRFRRLAKGNATAVHLGRSHLVYVDTNRDEREYIALDLRGRFKPRLLTRDDDFEFDCRCMQGFRTVSAPRVEGRYGYWVEALSDGNTLRTEINRVDLNQRKPEIFTFEPERQVVSFAVRAGRIVYSAYRENMVYEVARPAWRARGYSIPGSG